MKEAYIQMEAALKESCISPELLEIIQDRLESLYWRAFHYGFSRGVATEREKGMSVL